MLCVQDMLSNTFGECKYPITVNLVPALPLKY